MPPALADRSVPMILMIDNYDSFTFNLVQALEAAGAEVRVAAQRRHRPGRHRGPGGRSGGRPARHRHLARPRRPGLGRRVDGRDPRRRRAQDPAARRVPGHAGHGPGVRRHDPARPDARPRRGVERPPRREGAAGRACRAVPGGALPLAVRGPRHAPARDRGHRPDRGRRRRHGHPPPPRADGGRAVPPRVGAHARRARTCWRTSCGSPARARRSCSTERRARSP